MGKRIVYRIFLMLLVVIMSIQVALAQCAMCRATVENNSNNGESDIAQGLNWGILYLLAIPYIAAVVIGVFWYKKHKSSAKKIRTSKCAGS